MERNLEIVGFYDPASPRHSFLGKPIWRELQSADAHDARILTEITAPQNRMVEIACTETSIPLLVPDVLRLQSISK